MGYIPKVGYMEYSYMRKGRIFGIYPHGRKISFNMSSLDTNRDYSFNSVVSTSNSSLIMRNHIFMLNGITIIVNMISGIEVILQGSSKLTLILNVCLV